MRLFVYICVFCFSIILPAQATSPMSAGPITVTDLLGRSITLDQPAKRVLLGEGRFLMALSLVVPDNPVARLAGMLDEFKRLDPAGYDRYRQAFPALEDIPSFGQTTAESASIEKAIALNPDVAILGLTGHGPHARSEVMLRQLEAAGIPIVFIDFREDPLGNTPKSLRLLGQVLGAPEKAEAFAQHHEKASRKVMDRIAAANPPRPKVLIEALVGISAECCFTMANGRLATLAEAAGAHNIAQGLLPGATGVVSLEQILTTPPEIYIGSAIGSAADASATNAHDFKGRIVLGAGTSAEIARRSLKASLDRMGLRDLAPVQQGKAYGLWHHFYSAPLNAYALQVMAKWFHPTLFADLDPEALLAEMFAMMGPVDLSGLYAIGLEETAARVPYKNPKEVQP